MPKSKTRKNKNKKNSKRSLPTLAKQADKYELYQQSVQDPEHEVALFDKAYRQAFKKKPVVLREDFCGTFAVCCKWAKKRDRSAIGIDVDSEPLEWGKENNLIKLTQAQQENIALYQKDVREVDGSIEKADVLAAQNFSFFCFKTREELREYFISALENIAEQGIIVLDMMGGPECLEEDHEDIREHDNFTYVWEQQRFDPITHNAKFNISFRFEDDSALERIFKYDWRFWTIPEVREILIEAGFDETHVYWEGADEDGEGDGKWKKRKSAPSDLSWIAYIVGVKNS